MYIFIYMHMYKYICTYIYVYIYIYRKGVGCHWTPFWSLIKHRPSTFGEYLPYTDLKSLIPAFRKSSSKVGWLFWLGK